MKTDTFPCFELIFVLEIFLDLLGLAYLIATSYFFEIRSSCLRAQVLALIVDI